MWTPETADAQRAHDQERLRLLHEIEAQAQADGRTDVLDRAESMSNAQLHALSEELAMKSNERQTAKPPDESLSAADLEALRAARDLAKENYGKFRGIVADLGEDHRDGAHGLQRASREYAEATIRYSRALIKRTTAILRDKPE